MTADGVATSRRDLHAVHVFLHKEIVTDATCSTAGVLKDPLVINWKDASGPIPVDINTVGIPPQNHYSSYDWYWTLCLPNQHRDPEY